MNLTSNTITGSRVTTAESTVAQPNTPLATPQLELAFAAAPACSPARHQRRRTSRAAWWFQRMREIVDRTSDWQPARPTRPEQIWFPNTHRSFLTVPPLAVAQHQICE